MTTHEATLTHHVHNVATVTVYAETRDEAIEKSHNSLEKYFSEGRYKILSTAAEAQANETGFVTRWTVRVTAEAQP